MQDKENFNESQMREFLENSGFKEAIEKEEFTTQVMNVGRVQELAYVYDTLRTMAEGKGITVTKELNEPFKFMGSVILEGYHVGFSDPLLLTKMAEIANNTSVVPLTNGDVRLTFTFYGLTGKI